MIALRLAVAALLIALCGWFAVPAAAQETAPKIEKRQLLVPERNADGTMARTAFAEDPVRWIREKQDDAYSAIQNTLRRIKSGSPLAAVWTLMLLSFGYGVVHAAGPGHGKFVIASWLAATGSELRRGIAVSFMSAIVQALSAIGIVTVAALVLGATASSSKAAAKVVDSASYLAIAGLGLWLVWTAFRPVAHRNGGHAHHGHDRDHRGHEHHGGCGHAHMPTPSSLKGAAAWRESLPIALAVGMRPCTGAIVALVFAYAAGIYWAGVASAFVMALGTALTVSLIAVLTVYGRGLAMSLAGGDGRVAAWTGFALRLAGGLFIAALGILLFTGSLGRGYGDM